MRNRIFFILIYYTSNSEKVKYIDVQRRVQALLQQGFELDRVPVAPRARV